MVNILKTCLAVGVGAIAGTGAGAATYVTRAPVTPAAAPAPTAKQVLIKLFTIVSFI